MVSPPPTQGTRHAMLIMNALLLATPPIQPGRKVGRDRPPGTIIVAQGKSSENDERDHLPG